MALTEHDTAASPDQPRDPVLDRAYAAGASQEPPAHLDAAILAAARREVGARPRRPGPLLRAWRTPVAIAAVLVLSVSVVLLMREEGADRLDQAPPPMAAPSSTADSPPPADEARAANDARTAQPTAPRDKAEASSRAAPEGEVISRRRDAPATAPPAQPEQDRNRRAEAQPEPRQEAPRVLEAPRPAPRPFADPPAASSEARRGPPETLPPQTDTLAKQAELGAAAQARAKERVEAEQQAAKRAPAPPAAAASPDAAAGVLEPPPAKLMARPGVPESRARIEPRNDAAVGPRPVWQGYENQPPEKWLERVEELFRAGRDAEAREMLMEFRKRFPQHPVPPALNR